MVTMPYPVHAPSVRIFPTGREIRVMLQRPAVAVTAIICATVTMLAVLASVVFLAWTGRDTAVIGALLGGPVLALLGLLSKRLGEVREAVRSTPPPPSKENP